MILYFSYKADCDERLKMSSERKHIICFGDSNTGGFDPRSYFGDNYPGDIPWIRQLEKSGYEITDLGLNGRQIPSNEVELSNAYEIIRMHLPADLMTVMLGTNDLLMRSGSKAEFAASRMKKFMEYIRSRLPELRILLIGPVGLERGEWGLDRNHLEQSARLSGLYRHIADEMEVEFADASSWNVDIAFDGVHFSEAGHKIFAEELKNTLEELGL